MNHLTQEDLVFYHYGEEVPDGTVQHLSGCQNCREELASLRRVLSLVNDDETPERGESYGEDVWNRLRWKLGRSSSRSVLDHKAWKLAAVAALLLVGFLGGRFWDRALIAPAPLSTTANPQLAQAEARRDRVLLFVVGDHFDRSERMLLEVANSDRNSGVDVSSQQVIAEELIDQNRIFRQTASKSEQGEIAEVLGDLEPILLDIARGPSQLTASDLQEIQKRIESKGLVFKLRVIGSKVKERTQESLTKSADI